MESSRQPRGVFKGRYIDSSPQRDKLRFLDTQQALEYEDSLEPSVRYTDSLKTARSLSRERSQLRRMGNSIREEQD